MSERRKHITAGRVILALLAAALLSGALLYGADFFLKNVMHHSAMNATYYVAAGVAALIVFLLLVLPANRPLRGIKNVLRWLLVVIALVAVFAAGTAWDLQGTMMYPDVPLDAQAVAENRSNPALEEITVQETNGLVYTGWLWKNAPTKAGLIIYFGGNGEDAAGSVGSRAKDAQIAQGQTGWNLLMMDYPGYGGSQGEAGEESIYRMALAAWDAILQRPDVDPARIVVAGWSLGSGTAARLAAEKKPAGLILYAPFTNGATLVNAVAADMMSELPLDMDDVFGPNDWLLRNKYRSDRYAAQTQIPVLIIAAREDRVIPYPQAEALAALYPSHEFLLVEGGHSAPRHDPQALQAVAAYLQRLNATPAQPAVPDPATPAPVVTAAPAATPAG